MLFVLCCVHVNVWRFQAQAGAHSLHVLLARLMPKLVTSGWFCFGLWHPYCSYLTIQRCFLPFSGALQQVVCAVPPWPCTGALVGCHVGVQKHVYVGCILSKLGNHETAWLAGWPSNLPQKLGGNCQFLLHLLGVRYLFREAFLKPLQLL